MNGTDILADTNAIIYFVNGNDCMKPYRNNCFNVSIISEMGKAAFRRGIPYRNENRVL